MMVMQGGTRQRGRSLIISVAVLISCLLTFIAASQDGRYVLGGRNAVPFKWRDLGNVRDIYQPSSNMPPPFVDFVIALHSRTSDEQLLTMLKEVSYPQSPRYGRYLEHHELAALISPPASAFKSVENWLLANGIRPQQIRRGMETIHVSGCHVVFVEKLFHTHFHYFRNTRNNDLQIRQSGNLSIPKELQPIIRHVFGLSELVDEREGKHKPHHHSKKQQQQASINEGTGTTYGPKTLVTPAVLRDWYGIPSDLVASGRTRQSVYADLQFYNNTNLQRFCQLFGNPNQTCLVEKYVGFNCFTQNDLPPDSCDMFETEADLDVQYIMNLAPGVKTWFWEVMQNLEQIKQAFMTHRLPWVLNWAWQINNQTSLNIEAPLVHSISYGWPEVLTCSLAAYCPVLGYTSQLYINTTDRELMKMGLRGWTVVVSSGDDGAPGFAQNFPVKGYTPNGYVQELVISNGDQVCIFPTGGRNPECEVVLNNTRDGNNTSSCYSAWQYYVGQDTPWMPPPVYNGCLVNVTDWDMGMETINNVRVFPAVQTNCTFGKFPIYQNGSCSISPWAYNSSYGPAFMPDYPTSSPYVLSVGATQFNCQMSNGTCVPGTTAEVVASFQTGALVTGGGGFSQFHSRPDWQRQAVNAYLQQASLPPTNVFNMQGRGFPDIAVNGHNYQVVTLVDIFTNISANVTSVDGTSASAPAMAAMLSLYNDMLVSGGYPTLGWFNPMLYSLYGNSSSIVRDITQGNIACQSSATGICSAYGFSAMPGWDPASGIGSPQFKELLAGILSFHKSKRN